MAGSQSNEPSDIESCIEHVLLESIDRCHNNIGTHRVPSIQYRVSLSTAIAFQYLTPLHHRPFPKNIPHVHDNLVLQLQLSIRFVRNADDEDVAFVEHLFEGDEVSIALHVGVGGEDVFADEGELLFELVAERGAGVVAFGFEGHAKDADLFCREVVLSLEA